VAIQPNGKILAIGGGVNDEIDADIVLVRYNGDGSNFDLCLQDDSTGSIIQINSTTGDYQFANCGGIAIGGTGTINKKGGTYTLQHNSSDRRVTARIDTGANRGSATVTLFSAGGVFTIIDKNTANNSCACR
jgi:hypothetical protein